MQRRARVLAGFLGPLLAVCGGGVDVPADVIDREAFVATYVDLRRAAIASAEFQLTDEQRADILARHGVDDESLVRFANVHGRDLDYMNEVWTEIDARLTAEAGESEPPL
jgi:hypothetical protein